ncbi:MAG TPA: SDR family NAD(P)-dependent oxidoreductase [Geminicoccaceae bacterium]|nr:SDR family NAD(P)-dependent oxidoreductase [Geminicoccaceae bacterium]
MWRSNQAVDPRSILITGASSGIGAALACAYAGPGSHLALGARDADRLAAVAERCRAAGAVVTGRRVDVTEREAMAAWIAETDDARPLDLVVANAGISGPETPPRRIVEVNLLGVLNTVEPILPRFLARRRGHLALMSSLAAFRATPTTPAYGASKAAVLAYGDALRPRLAAQGVRVTVICPGFVRTPMTAGNPFAMPLIMTPERAALIIRAGLERGRPRIVFPRTLYLVTRLAAALPHALVDAILGRQPPKENL